MPNENKSNTTRELLDIMESKLDGFERVAAVMNLFESEYMESAEIEDVESMIWAFSAIKLLFTETKDSVQAAFLDLYKARNAQSA